ncbi:MAG: polysaccharide biosynthesis tyrosine autokinase [Bacteroidota bacterium]|nr:polysaccharide biosynthesis tyrosine autokinase [Bacteroidota bacterium]
MNPNDLSEENEKIDLKNLLGRFLIFWKLILLSSITFLIIGVIYIRYTSKVYKSSTTLLIKEESNSSLGAENLFDGIDLFGGQKNIKNEIGILKSFSLTKKTLEQINFRISYFHDGKLKSEEIYKKSPFNVELSPSKNTIINQEFHIKIISENEFNISIDCDKVKPFDLKTEKFASNVEMSVNYNKNHQFGELISTPYFEFTVLKNNFELFTEDDWDSYYFKIHNYNELTDEYLSQQSVIEIDKDASILRISLEGKNPRKINDFLEKFNQLYLQLGLNEKNQIASNTIFFINNQLTSISDSLSKVENELERFKKKNPKVQIISKDFSTFSQIEKLEEEKAILEFNNKYYLSLKTYFDNNNSTKNIVVPSAMGINDPLLNELISELSNLYSQLEVASVNSKEEHPVVQSLQKQISNTKVKLNENIENIISSSELSLIDIDKRIGKIEGKIEQLPQQERLLLNIQRKFNLNENIYNYLLEKRAEASITKASNVSDHKVIDNPRLISKYPIKPKQTLVFLMCLVFGIGLPILGITIYFTFNNKIIDKKDIDLIISFPNIGKIIFNQDDNDLINVNNPKSSIAESFRSIRTNIQYLASDKKEKVICLTSSVSGEGKTFVSMNLASIISLTGEKTLLIGADLRKPKISDSFKLKNTVGLSSYLSNQNTKEEIIKQTNNEHLDIILSGPIPPNPSELLNLQKMKNLLEELKSQYKYIIIDTPPIGLVSDGIILMDYSDINLYVVRQNFTTKDMLHNFKETVNYNKLKDINIVINGITTNRSSYGYGYGYGNENGYGYYHSNKKEDKKWWEKFRFTQ